MSKKNSILEKVMIFLRVRSRAGGLEISNTAIRFAKFDGREWKMFSLRLPKDVLKGAQILNYQVFVQALKKLKSQISSSRGQNIPVIVSLSSLNIYSQVMNLPILDEDRIEEAVKLNIQMATPADISTFYLGWQVVGSNESEKKADVLAAFIDSNIIDDFNKALREAGFFAIVFEPRSLAIARLAREQGVGIDLSKSYAALVLDNDTLDFVILRHGNLYFEYLNYWKDLNGENKVISLLDFKNAVTNNLRQVMNFYSQHWPDKIEAVVLITSGLNEEIKKIISNGFSLPVKDLGLRLDRPVGSDWFTVLGSGLRGVASRKEDREISLLGTTARSEFRIEQIVSFIKFWRVLLPAATGLLLLFFIAANFILMKRNETLKAQTAIVDNRQFLEVQLLQKEATVFNRSLDLIVSSRSSPELRSMALERIYKLVRDNGITLTRFNFSGFNTSLVFYGQASSQNQIIEFKKALEAALFISDVKLPLTEIKPGPQGFSFLISFLMTSSNVDSKSE